MKVVTEVVLDYDTIAPLLKEALADDQAIYDRFGPEAGYLINVVAQNARDALTDTRNAND